jgi:4a-hydroxytetrahydrobiopterin dehydratase
MSRRQALSQSQIVEALKNLPLWSQDGGFIRRDFEFQNFREAFSFMTAVALLAETQDHHPNWENVYNRLTIRLSTHDANGITIKDVELAKSIDEITT